MKERIDRPSAQRIIDTIVSTMKENIEPFDVEYSLVPAIYLVFLHPEDYEEVRSFSPDIVDYACSRLDGELQKINHARSSLKIKAEHGRSQGGSTEALVRSQGREGGVKRAGSSWEVTIKPSLGVISVKKGAVVVWPKLVSTKVKASGLDKNMLSGDSTRRVMMILDDTGKLESHLLGEDDAVSRGLMDAELVHDETIRVDALPNALDFIPVTSDLWQIAGLDTASKKHNKTSKENKLATLSYREGEEMKSFKMVTKELAVGRKDRGSQSYVQLQILASTDVSREHFRIRLNKADQSFEIKDVSRYGTWVNKERIAPSFSTAEGGDLEKQDLEKWHALPDKATINLAGVLDIHFKSHAR